jgi:hypothetical protein
MGFRRLVSMRTPDPCFADPRLAVFYDVLDGDRSDLDAYVATAAEVDARTVLDLGCGRAHLARSKSLAERGTWIH